jgi:NADPH2:quinone reductase
MKAAIIRDFGGPERFEIADVARPVPGPKQALVRLVAASVNPVDYKIRKAGAWAGVPMPAILGYDAAGVVEAVGAQATRFKPGDEVFYSARIFGRQGTYAQYHVEDEEILALKPAQLEFEQAAAVPLAAMTAYDAVITFFQTKPGDTVLIHAGAGGVGHFAVQLAKAAGARVLATGRAVNTELIKSLGADEVIDYQKTKFEAEALRFTGGIGVDAAYDTVGGDTVSRSIQAVRPYGKLATIVSLEGSLQGMQIKNQTLYFGFLERTEPKIQAMKTLVERRQVKPLIDSVFPLEKIADAHRKLEAGGIKGKIVIKI